jgi:hypothetical protein
LFDPAWQIFDSEGRKINALHLLVNMYANGWFLVREGNYNLTIKYKPQDLVDISEKVSLVAFISGIVFLVIRLRSKI